jgi:hypothetical protein
VAIEPTEGAHERLEDARFIVDEEDFHSGWMWELAK